MFWEDSKGVILIGIFGYLSWKVYKSYNKSQTLKNQLQQFLKICQTEVNFKQIKQNSISKKVMIKNVKPMYNKYSFKYYLKQIPIGCQNQKVENIKLQNMSGGHFQFKCKGYNNICNISDCTISSSVLTFEKTSFRLFPQYYQQPVVTDIQITFDTLIYLTIYGVISYDIQSKKFIVSPSIIAKNALEISQIFRQKIFDIDGEYIFYLLLSLVGGYFFIVRPLVQRIKRFKKEDDLEYFNNINIKSKQSQKYICMICKINQTNIVLSCGHLSICDHCESNPQINKKCPICNKKSVKSMKIYP